MAAPARDRSRLRAFQALRGRDFRLLFLGQVVSLVGDAAFLTALGWRTFSLSGSGAAGRGARLPVDRACSPRVLIGGALADRFSRRLMMIVSDAIRFFAVGGLALVDASGHLTVGWIAVFAIVVGLGDGLFYPAFGGMVPLVVDQPMIASANSVIGIARWGSILVGPALAGLLYAPAGSATVFAVDAGHLRRLGHARLAHAPAPRRAGRGRGPGHAERGRERLALRAQRAVALGDDRALRARADAPVRARSRC